MPTLSPLTTLAKHPRVLGAAAFSKDGARFATGAFSGDNSIRIWTAGTFEPVARLRGHAKNVRRLAFARDVSLLASASTDRTVAVWDVARGERLAKHEHHRAIASAVAIGGTDSRLVASGGHDGSLCLWDWRDGGSPRSIPAHAGYVNALALSPEGEIVATGGGTERASFGVCVWEVASGRAIRALDGHTDWPLWLGFSPSGDVLASGSYGEICLWDVGTWQLRATLRRPEELRFSTTAFSFTAISGLFVSGGWAHDERNVEVRDATGKCIGWNVERQGLVQSWDLDRGALLDSFVAHGAPITCLAASPTEDLLVTGGQEGVTKIWRLG